MSRVSINETIISCYVPIFTSIIEQVMFQNDEEDCSLHSVLKEKGTVGVGEKGENQIHPTIS